MAPRPSLAAEVTAPARPGIGRLSLVALFCFAVGLAWPLLADLDFVQRPPGSSPSKAEESDPAPLESEPEPKPSSAPPPKPSSPVRRDEGVRAAAHVAPATKPRAPEPAEATPDSDRLIAMSGQATIGWKQALVRDEPSGQGKILDRLAYGARVNVTGRKGDWYRVKYGRKVRAGWVHRNALGL